MTQPASPHPTPEALRAEHDWARRLAHRRVRDAALAEDLAQEATARALQHAPEGGLRAWIGGIVRNLARQGRREHARRLRREELAAQPEAQPSAADALERLAVQQDVVRAVLALEEPYRSTVVLRFYENLPPRKIAARQGVPVATVKTRLARGLALLRGELDREHGGDGRAWALFLLPLAERPTPILPLVAGTLAVNTLPKLFAAAAALVGIVWFASRANVPRTQPEEVALAATPVELREAEAPAEEPRAAEPAREAAAPVASSKAAASAPAEEPPAAISGRVIDHEGLPVAGVALGLRSSRGVRIDTELSSSILWEEELPTAREPLAFSGPDGRFALAPPEGFGGYVVSQDPRWETVLGGGLQDDEDEPLLVVAPLFRLNGRVVDEAGTPIESVELVFIARREGLQLSGLDLASSRSNGWSTSSDVDGRFAFERLPSVPGSILHARLEPYERQQIARDDWHDDRLEIVLREPPGGWVEGRVESGGVGLARATVTLGYRATETDADGSFRLSLAGLEEEHELCALARGLLPERVLGDRNEDGSVRWPSFVRIELEGETLSLAGVVVDEHGSPLAGHEVWLEDPGIAYVQGQGFAMLLEAVLAGTPEMRHGSKTDENGRFEILALEERDYRLRVIDPATALLVDYGPFAAGERDLRLERPAGSFWPRLRGKLVTRSGAPLAGLSVNVERDAAMVGVRNQFFAFQAHGARATSAADGSFELVNVPRNGVTLHAHGPGSTDPELELGADVDPDALEVRVAASVQLHLRVGSSHPTATEFGVLDADGKRLDLVIPTDGGSMRSNSIALSGSVSPVTRLSDAGVTLVLTDAKGQELARLPIALQPGVVNTIDL